MSGLELAWQKFVGVEMAVPGHGLKAPIIMDATVEQVGGYRFVYSLPFSSDRLMVEDTYYTNGAQLDEAALAKRIADYASSQGWSGTAGRQEVGILPILLGGDPDLFWPASDPVARLAEGVFFHLPPLFPPASRGHAISLSPPRSWRSALALDSRRS